MIPDIGFYVLVTGLVLSVWLVGVLAWDIVKSKGSLSLREREACGALNLLPFAICLCLITTFLCLMISYVTSDFSVLNVAMNSHTQKPLLYKITGTWGNHEGSMLLWTAILSVFTAAFALCSHATHILKKATLLVQGTILIGFLTFILLTSNPFERVDPVPQNGMGLNPLLQDIGLALHPPLLYLGYVGFSITFSMAIALLLFPRTSMTEWAKTVKPWAMVSWAFLTLGIGMGSWWAYRELGWGGFWFWDPVENASLMPWLAGTAFVHSLLVLEKRDALKRWSIFLALLTFSLSLLGTFLVRSGVLTSVHSFANDPERGVFILALLAFFIGVSLLLYGLRAHRLESTDRFAVISRETSLMANNLFVLTACATVILGTLYPLLLEVATGTRLSIGAPYFNQTFNIITLPLLLLAVIGPALNWKKDSITGLAKKLWLPALSAPLAWGIIALLHLPTSVVGILALALSLWLVTGIIFLTAKRIRLFQEPLATSAKLFTRLPKNFHGMVVAHLGLALLVLGITAASDWQVEKQYAAERGSRYEIGPYSLELNEIAYMKGENYLARQAVFYVWQGNREVAHLMPETRHYPVEQSQTTESAIYTSLFSDLYIAIGEMDDKGIIAVRLYYKPLINLIWLGCFLMAAGALLAIIGKKREE